jgi:hypothetical protein
LISKGLKLYPVSSVAQTIEILFANAPVKKNLIAWRVYPKKKTLMFFLLFLVLLTASTGLVLWKDRQLPPEQAIIEKPESISGHPQLGTDQPVIEDKPHENQEDTKVDEQGIITDPEAQIMEKNFAEIKEKAPESTDIEQPIHSAAVNIFGSTKLNAEISKVLTTKLKKFFALPHHHLGVVEDVTISGQVVVLRMEETWVEERQRFKSSIRVALRDFVYKDKTRKVERPNIEVTVYARGMVEDMLPMAAQELMNKMLTSLLSDENDDHVLDPPESGEKNSTKPEQTDTAGSD